MPLNVVAATALMFIGMTSLGSAQTTLETVNITNPTTEGFTVEFNAVTNAASYIVSVEAFHDQSDTATFPTTSTSVMVTGRRSNILYRVTVSAINGGTVISTIHTTARTAPNGVEVLSFITTPTFITIFLEQIPGVTAYQVEVTNTNNNVTKDVVVPDTVVQSHYVSIVRGLLPNTNYSVRARASQIARVDYTSTQSPYGPVKTAATDKISAFGSVTLSADAGSCNSDIAPQLLAAYQSQQGNVENVVVLPTIATATTLCQHEIILSDQSLPPNISSLNLATFNSTLYSNFVVRFRASGGQNYGVQRSATNERTISYADLTCTSASFDTLSVYSKLGLVGSGTIAVTDNSAQSIKTVTFSNSRVNNSEGGLNVGLDPGTIYAIQPNYLVEPCIDNIAGDIYDRLFSSELSATHNQDKYAILYTTAPAPMSGSQFIVSSFLNGSGLVVNFSSSILNRASAFTVDANGTTATLDQNMLDSSAEYLIPIHNLTAGASYQLTVTGTSTGVDGTTYSTSSGPFAAVVDENECIMMPGICDANAFCTNTPPYSYTCECNLGYTGNGTTCYDEDECISDPCEGFQRCVNNVGSYQCINISDPNVRFSGVTTSSFVIEWSADEGLTYQVTVTPGSVAPSNVTAPTSTRSVSGLDPGTEYTVTVAVVGKAVSSTASQFTVPGGVGGFRIGVVRDVSVTFTWHSTPPGSSMVISLTPITMKRSTPGVVSREFTGTEASIGDLTPATNYLVEAYLRNSGGNGTAVTTRLRTSPSPVTGLAVVEDLAGQVNVSWSPSSGAELYRVSVPSVLNTSTTDSVIVLTLPQDMNHTVEVRACLNDTSGGTAVERCSDPRLRDISLGISCSGGCPGNAECTLAGCVCNPGYSGSSCLDDNECTLSTHNCTGNTSCFNVAGGFRCCENGTSWDGSRCVDNCAGVVCQTNAFCNAFNDGSCQCNDGFDNRTGICEDINECMTSTKPCGNGTCNNTIGSYTCNCAAGFMEQGGTCVAACTNCHPNAYCVGPDTCQCNSGFTGDGTACAELCGSSDVCGANASCYAVEDTPQCGCNVGHVGNEVTCLPCAGSLIACSPNATCNETTKVCVCNPGFSGVNENCVDVNECDLNPGICHDKASCDNVIGSYQCTCNEGYTGDGVACNLVCGTQICHANATCGVLNGMMSCECIQGHAGDGLSCEECVGDIQTCYPNANCTDVGGIMTCTCKTGFTGTYGNCFDMDECVDSATCHANATCQNTPGAYTCTCDANFTGDGRTCHPLPTACGVQAENCSCGTQTCAHQDLCSLSTSTCSCLARDFVNLVFDDKTRPCAVNGDACSCKLQITGACSSLNCTYNCKKKQVICDSIDPMKNSSAHGCQCPSDPTQIVNVAAIVIPVVAVLLLLIFIILVWSYRRRHQSGSYNVYNRMRYWMRRGVGRYSHTNGNVNDRLNGGRNYEDSNSDSGSPTSLQDHRPNGRAMENGHGHQNGGFIDGFSDVTDSSVAPPLPRRPSDLESDVSSPYAEIARPDEDGVQSSAV